MELVFATSDIEVSARSENSLRKIFGTSARRACQRLLELAATENLAVAATLPTLQLTQQAGTSRFSVSISPAHCILFEPSTITGLVEHRHYVDLASVTAIRILSLGGIHDS